MSFTIAPKTCFCSDGKTAIDYLVARGMQNLIDDFIDQGLRAILGQGSGKSGNPRAISLHHHQRRKDFN